MLISIDKAQKFYDKIKKGLQGCTPVGYITFKIDPAYTSEEIIDKASKKAAEINKANEEYFILQEESLNLKSIIFKTNIQTGLHDKLNKLSLLKSKKSQIKGLIRRDTELMSNITKEFMDKKIQLIKDSPNMSIENFTVLIKDNSINETELKIVEKEIVLLEDEIKELNYSTKIEIDLKPETIEYLDL